MEEIERIEEMHGQNDKPLYDEEKDFTEAELSGVDGFAWEWGKAHDRAVEDTDRLIGFCLLFRRSLLSLEG